MYSRVNSVPEYMEVTAISNVMPIPGSHPKRAYAAGNSHKPQPSCCRRVQEVAWATQQQDERQPLMC
jgi:hypothetical protein